MKAYCLYCKYRKIVKFKRMCIIKKTECPNLITEETPDCDKFSRVNKLIELLRKLRLMYLYLKIKYSE